MRWSTETEIMGPLCRREQPRKLGWKRRPREEWRTQTERVWWSWCHQHPSKSVEELWGSWKHTFDDSAKRWVGKAKGKRTNHWEGVWDMEMQYWSKQKNWKRKQGLDHKFEKRQLRRRKRQLARLRRKARMDKLRKLRVRDPREYWKKVQRMMGKVDNGIPKDLTYKGAKLDDESEKAAWANMFLEQDEIPIAKEEETWVTNVVGSNWKRSYCYWNPKLDTDFSKYEIWEAIREAPNGKAVGVDEIPMDLVKDGGEAIKDALGQVFREVWEKEEIPKDWKRGVVVPIPKSGDPHAIENYRGITLLSTVGKTFVSILNKRVSRWLETEGKLANEQAGFREGFATVDQIFILNELINRQKKAKKKWVCAFLDIKRAYDVVWRDAMWKIMWESGIRGKMWRVIQKLYEGVESCVEVNGSKSEWKGSTVGVRQGCVISPTLFSVFINGMAEDIRSANRGIKWKEKTFNILMFADDVVLVAENEGDMNHMLGRAYEYSRRHRFKFNASKCKVMSNLKDTKWLLGGEEVKQVEEFTYLGVTFGKRAGWKHMEEKLRNLAGTRVGRVLTMRRMHGIAVSTCARIWEAIGEPVMNYGAEVWDNRRPWRRLVGTWVRP